MSEQARDQLEKHITSFYHRDESLLALSDELELDGKLLHCLPASWPSLRYLLLSCCKNLDDDAFGTLISRVPRLTTLVLMSCRGVTDISAHAIAKCLKCLTMLHLERCEGITDVGIRDIASSCPNLERLNLLDMGLSRLPEALRQHTHLKYLDIHGNPALGVPDEVVSQTQDALAILDFYFASRKRPLYEAKVLLIGEGRVGKTHLRHRLINGDQYYYNKRQPHTHNIELSLWAPFLAPLGSKGETVNAILRVWDVGGQPNLHASHRFFLDDQRNLFILVLDATRTAEENRLRYWLRYIRHFTTPKDSEEAEEFRNGAPVIIAITQCDRKRDRRLNLPSVEDLRDETKANLIDAIEGLGWRDDLVAGTEKQVGKEHESALEKLRAIIAQTLPEVRGIAIRYEDAFYKVKEWIEGMFHAGDDGCEPHKYLTKGAYEQACDEYGLANNQRESMLLVLRSLGLLHRVHGDLADCLFNPWWVKGPAYALVSAATGDHQHGVISRDDFARITECKRNQSNELWGRMDFDELDRRRVLGLMQVCELAFPIHRRSSLSDASPDAEEFLVPDLLPTSRSKGEKWSGATTHTLEYEFLPENVPLRFMGRKYEQVKNPPEEHCFRNKVVLRQAIGPCEALIQPDIEAASIHIQIRGGDDADRQRFLGEIEGGFGELLIPQVRMSQLTGQAPAKVLAYFARVAKAALSLGNLEGLAQAVQIVAGLIAAHIEGKKKPLRDAVRNLGLGYSDKDTPSESKGAVSEKTVDKYVHLLRQYVGADRDTIAQALTACIETAPANSDDSSGSD